MAIQAEMIAKMAISIVFELLKQANGVQWSNENDVSLMVSLSLALLFSHIGKAVTANIAIATRANNKVWIL